MNHYFTCVGARRVLKLSKPAEWPAVFKRENMLDITGLDDGFPVIAEIPKSSDTLGFKWHVRCDLHTMQNSIDTKISIQHQTSGMKIRKDACREAKDESIAKMGISNIAKSSDLGENGRRINGSQK